MGHQLELDILPQPDDTTCGPTCLHAVYRYFGSDQPLPELIRQVPALPEGGTLAVHLACHALARGHRARIHTFNLHVFDPTWFALDREQMARRLERRREARQDDAKLVGAISAYLRFLALGGEIRLDDLTPRLIRRYLKRGIPVLTGLSATYLYRGPREIGESNEPDDVSGEPAGHFVVLCGLDAKARRVRVADPYRANPVADGQFYEVDIERVACSILLGILTYDANLLAIAPKDFDSWPS